ncbi:MAG TPA: DUF1598 domain-containing protein [Pirellulales bacterium]|jgi:hypothetical protein|nr:DUF1598 domain-containing protein [Pirellulales bacterium]
MRVTPRNNRRILALAVAGLLTAWLPLASRSPAQIINQAPLVAGVSVDANGVLKMNVKADPTGQLSKLRREQARGALDSKVATPSKLRKVSINRLEEAVKNQIAAGKRPTEEMMFLAGLTRVQYVFCYPDSKDIVLAGPAEGWGRDLTDRVVGIQTGRPVIELQDLIVALRLFPPGGRATPLIGCSIDPTKEGLARLQDYIHRAPPNGSGPDTERFVAGMKETLGLQNVTVNGVPSDTHFAHVLVEADYRMKLIGIGLERPPISLKSYVDRANPNMVSRNALERWYFVPDYQCVRVSDDDLAMQLVGEGVKLVGADELVGANGERQQTSGRGNPAAKAFADEFTKKYPQLSAALPIYAQLRNLIDLSVVAAFMQQRDFFSKAEWRMEGFGNEATMPVKTENAPKQVETAVNAVWRGSHLMTPIGGGVHISPHEAISTSNLLPDDGGKVSQARDKVEMKNLSPGQWWWD